MSKSNIVLGIDLGTTNCSVSIKKGNDLQVIDDSGDVRIPSIVHFSKKDGSDLIVEVGKRAKKFLLKDATMTIFDSKRMLGRQFTDPDIQKLIPQWPFKVEEDEDGGILIVLEKFDIKLKPYQVSGYLLKHLAEVGNKVLKPDEKTSNVIITIPANFGDEQREETKKAVEFAGLNLLEMINEPTSAGISYGMREKSSESSNIIVFDFGGGTLDVSFLSIHDNDFKIEGSDGDMFLGGRNFDNNLIDFFVDKFHIEDIRDDPKKMEKLRDAVVKAKEELSSGDESEIELDFLDLDDDDEYTLTVEEFEEINQDLIDKILIPIERLLRNLKKTKDDVNYVLLVGGSSRMRFVKKKITEYFEEEPFFDINSNTAVARGAGYVASEFSQKKDEETKDKDMDSIFKTFKFHDICAFSIGTQTFGGRFYEIIERGSEIPKQKEETFSTVFYRQDSIDIYIFQGNSERIEDNYCLGYFTVSELPISDNPIEFQLFLKLDRSGILSATATIPDFSISTGKNLKVRKIQKGRKLINHDFKSLSEDQIQTKLFLINIQRFINFNKDDIIDRKCYSESDLESILNYAKYLEDNPDCDEMPDDFSTLVGTFVFRLKNYLNKFKPEDIPEFFGPISAW